MHASKMVCAKLIQLRCDLEDVKMRVEHKQQKLITLMKDNLTYKKLIKRNIKRE